MRIVVSFSGGKDSQACLIWAVEKYGKDKVEAVFCDTGWEHPSTYDHINQITNKIGIPLSILKNKDNETFKSLCVKFKIFPDAKRRFCTAILKIQPMIDWVLQQKDNLIIIQGIRGSESQSRAKMAKECSYFAEYFTDSKKSLYRKADVLKWVKNYDASVLRPIFEWTSQNVVDYILQNNSTINPLYKKGAARVGCYPCIFARQGEIRMLSKDKAMLDRLLDLEMAVNNNRDKGSGSFFPSSIPTKYCANKKFATVTEVVNYVNRNQQKEKLFEENTSCMSIFHGLCE